MYIQRVIERELLNLQQQYPVITVLGPRQSGKTTLVRHLASDKTYINLVQPETRELVQSDPKAFLQQHTQGCILDEVQLVPELLSYIQAFVDDTKEQGLFILTGSNQTALSSAVSQSLAGRTAIVNLLPLSMLELHNADFVYSEPANYILKGFFPRIYDKQQNHTQAYANYVRTYLERDVRQLINLKDQRLFHHFLILCAGRIGQELNMNSLGNQLGISSNTIKEWLSVLQASFVVTLLQPYYANIGKRLTKSPKLYFNDTGLACYLLGIEEKSQLIRDPLYGSLFENMIILDMIKAKFNQVRDANFYFYRDHNQNEVDLLTQSGHRFNAYEIKSSQTFNTDFLKGLDYLGKIMGDNLAETIVIYAGKKSQSIKTHYISGYYDLLLHYS